MTTELTTQDLPITQDIDRPMSAGELTKQALLIQEILEKVMVGPTPDNPIGVHYGIIPGTQKKTLYQAGAEKICATFRLAPKYSVDDLSEPHNNFYRYRVACSLYTIRDGLFVGSACGEASTAEEKYSWQKAVCDAQFEDADPSKRRKKWQEDGTFIRQVARNSADLANTVLKIACKRAYVSATRGATAASDLLEVDLEEEAIGDLAAQERHEHQSAAKPKAKPKPAPSFSYGKFKGIEITDPSIPLDYLEFMANSTAASLDDPKKAKFKAQNQLFVAALDAEIAFRKQAPPQEPAKQPDEQAKTALGEVQAPKAGVTKDQLDDVAWATFLSEAEEHWFDLYQTVKEQFNVASGHDLPKEKRADFHAVLQAEIDAATKQ